VDLKELMATPLRTRVFSPDRPQTGSPWGWALAGLLLGGILVTLVFAPARWLTTGRPSGANAQVLLEDARGTLWRGSARLSLSGGAGSSAMTSLAGRVSWDMGVKFVGFAPALTLRLTAPCCWANAWEWRVVSRWSGAQVVASDMITQFPLALLAGLGTPWNTVDAQGQLAVQTRALTLDWASGRLQVAGELQADASDVSSRLSTVRPMGSYRLTLTGGRVPVLALSTLSGPLQLSGRGEWVGGKLRFTGAAASTPESLPVLSNLLNIIGRREGARSIIQLG